MILFLWSSAAGLHDASLLCVAGLQTRIWYEFTRPETWYQTDANQPSNY